MANSNDGDSGTVTITADRIREYLADTKEFIQQRAAVGRPSRLRFRDGGIHPPEGQEKRAASYARDDGPVIPRGKLQHFPS